MRGKKPTIKQGKFMQANNLNWEDWLTQKDTPELLQIVNRTTQEVRVLKKEN